MTRESTVLTERDAGGEYEVEVFGCEKPKSIIVCSHGNGVRRWDGEKFFYAVAEHYPEHVFLLADQNQPYEDGCKLNSLKVMVARVQGLVDKAVTDLPGVPVIVMGHSMGCGVASQLNLDNVSKVVFVAPAAGEPISGLVERYGESVLEGRVVKTSDGLTKFISKEYVDSVRGIIWEREYEKLLERFKPVYVFEAGEEEIVGDERLKHRDLSFADYEIIPGATHNFHGEALTRLFTSLDPIL